MAHPKSRTSKTKQRKRRGGQGNNIKPPHLVTCSTTGIKHRPHEGYIKDGHLYYRGKLIRKNFTK